jgi:hypothetical protein
MSNREQKLTLFSYYAANLSIYHPDYKDQFMCPLCQRIFSKEDLDAHPPKISVAHAPPDAIGGRLKTLACTECDNKIGECDRQVKYEKDAADDFENKIIKNAVFISSKGTRLPCELDIKKDKLEHTSVLVVNKPRMPSEHYRKIAERVRDDYSSGAPFEFTIETESHKREPDRWLISQIYAAFLIMFYHFGYEYALNTNVKDIRRALNDGDILKYKNAIISIHKKTSPEPISRPVINIQTTPKDLQCFLVEIPSPKKDDLSRTIALPGFGDNAKKSYENLMNLYLETELNFTCKRIEFNKIGKILPDPNSKGFGESIWKKATNS